MFKCTFVCEQKEKFQVYERYCQNKPRSELLWRQCADSLFFQVVAHTMHSLSLFVVMAQYLFTMDFVL